MNRDQKLQLVMSEVAARLLSTEYSLVEVKWNQHDSTMQVFISRKDGNPVGIKDCVNVDHVLDEAVFEPFSSASKNFYLEVSSPGIE